MTDDTIPAEWQGLLEEFERRRQAGRAMGGSDKLEKRRATGKLNAREVLALFCDDGSFMELGTLVGGVSYTGEPLLAGDGLVGGLALVDGRPVVVAIEDFTVKGGSIGHGGNAKRVRYARLAAQEKIPYVLFLDGAGYRATNALERHPYAPSDLVELAQLSGQVPTVAVVLGASAGHGALTGLLADFLVMLDDAVMFSAGPPLVAAALGERLSKEELGGARMHAGVSGVCHNLAHDEADACRIVRRYLGFLPSNAWEAPARHGDSSAAAPRSLDDILTIVPRDAQRPYDIRKVIARLVDDADSILEIQPDYGTALVTTLARVGGWAVGIVTNQPTVLAGSINSEAAYKATHFIDLCNAWHLPVLFLADNPGILPGSKAERSGALRAAARMYTAQAQLRSPKIHVTLRKAFGFGSSIMGMNPFDRQTLTLAFPGITLGGIPAIGGGAAAKADEQTQQQLRDAELSGAWSAGDNMAYDEIIDPRELRNAILRGLDAARHRLQTTSGPLATRGIRP